QHALGRPTCDVAQLVLAPPAVVLYVNRDTEGMGLASRDEQVHQVLQACQLLPPPTDEHAQVIALDVELRRLGAHRDLDGPLEVHQAQELFEHCLRLIHYGALLLGELLHGLGGNEGNGFAGRAVTPVGTLAAIRAGRAISAGRATAALGPLAESSPLGGNCLEDRRSSRGRGWLAPRV